METPKEFLLRKEVDLVNVLDEETFMEEKIYFPGEVIDFIAEYSALQKAEIMKNLGLKPDGKVF